MPRTKKPAKLTCSRRRAGEVVDSGDFSTFRSFKPVSDKIVRRTFNPEGGSELVPVSLVPATGNVCPGGAKKCQTQLITSSTSDGFAVRLCTGVKKGVEVPVRTALEAQRVSQQYCACRRTKKDAVACARQTASPSERPGAPLSALEAYRRGRASQTRFAPQGRAKVAPRRRKR